MNSRLTIQDLAVLLAEQTGKDKNSAEQFLQEFIAVVSQGAFTDKIVKVKGFGTFKVIPVEKRESIHVNTGERFLIPAHYKFSFRPDKELRDLVNKPFSFFDTTELSEGVDFADLEVPAAVEEKEDKEPTPTPPADDIPQADPVLEDKEPTPAPWMKGLVAVALILLIVAGSLFLYINRSFFIGSETPSRALSGGSLPDYQPAASPEPARKDTTFTVVEQPAESPEPPAETSEVLATTTIERGSRLTLIALEYYGSKLFWVYLYDYNKAVIKDPNNIPVGTEIQIPVPTLYGIDKQSRASIEKAAARQTEILTGNL